MYVLADPVNLIDPIGLMGSPSGVFTAGVIGYAAYQICKGAGKVEDGIDIGIEVNDAEDILMACATGGPCNMSLTEQLALQDAIDSLNQESITKLMEGAYDLGGAVPNTSASGIGPISVPSPAELAIREGISTVKSYD